MTYRARTCRPARRRQGGQLGTGCNHDCNQGRTCSCKGQPLRWDALGLTRLALVIYAIGALTYFFAS